MAAPTVGVMIFQAVLGKWVVLVGRFLAEVKHPISSGHHDRRTIAVHPLRRSGEACQHLLVHPATMSNGISLSNHLDRDSRGDQCIDSDFT